MPKLNQSGFVPIIVIFLTLLIVGSAYVIVKNSGIGEPGYDPTASFQGSVSGQIKPKISPSVSPSNKKFPSSFSPTKVPTTTPTASNNSSASNSSNGSSSNNSNNQSNSSNNSAATNTPTPSLTTASPATLMSVDKTTVNVTISKAGKTSGYLYGSYGSGVTITSNSGSGYSLANDQGQSGVGIGTYGSSGLLPGKSYYLAPFITADKANGIYTGTNTFTYYDSQSKSYPGATISYTITLTD